MIALEILNLLNISKYIQQMKRKNTKPFQNSWAVTYHKPHYDALDDPHASYYFLGRPMKKHLKHLRKSIDNEGTHVQKKKINKMINARLRQFNDLNRSTKVEVYFGHLRSQSSSASLYKSSDLLEKQLIKQRSKTKISYNRANDSQRSNSKVQRNAGNLPKLNHKTINIRRQKQKNSLTDRQTKIIDNVENEIEKIQRNNKSEHKKFLTFLMNKRKTIETNVKEEPIKNL